MSEQLPEEKSYEPGDTTLKFVDRPDDIDPYSSEQRAEMSCGHAVTPESLTGWCRDRLGKGHYTFECPSCHVDWPYTEVRRLAALTAEEIPDFEMEVGRLAAKQLCDFKECPGCKTYVERETLDNLCFDCNICKDSNKPTKRFCWQCLKPWKGRAPRSDRCDNDDCSDKDLELLQRCADITLSDVKGVGPVPSIRACPTCGMRVEHNQKACKNIVCPRCEVQFCFVCLKLTTKCLETSRHYKACSSGIAPRQTAMPIWKRK